MKSWSEMTAEDIMSTPIITLDRGMSVEEAARRLSSERVSGALVADTDGSACGVISLFDITSHLAGFEQPPEGPGGFYRQGYFVFGAEAVDAKSLAANNSSVIKKLLSQGLTVGEIMSREILTVLVDEPIAQVARTLRERQIHRVFVTDGSRLVGVVSTMDVLGALAGIPHSRSRIPG